MPSKDLTGTGTLDGFPGSRIDRLRATLAGIAAHEDVNFLLTNRIPRHLATRFIAWFGKIEHPLVRDLSIGAWRLFADPALDEAKTTRFRSLHDCFVRELKPGARPINTDPAVAISPCDAIVGACGAVEDGQVIQAKGFPYALAELLPDPALVDHYRNGRYVTLRLTSSMYHRFHAPHDLRVDEVTYVSGDTWNTNPIALKRVEKLFCKNERAVIRTVLRDSGHMVTLVAVASILVASIRLHCLDRLLHLDYQGPNRFACQASYQKGAEMGWFELGSTIIVFAPGELALCPGVRAGAVIRMGEPLLRAG
ncbi:MAG TPA: archaetidylserine decarboxylase [Polyangia bacterium]|nr:archaetidylserine decarboxylase [Polyangia bacterium]